MSEVIISAIVLDREPTREYDEYIHLYSREHGRLVARAVSSRKMHSKFSHHLDPLNRVDARLVGNGQFVLTDAVQIDRFVALRANREELLKALRLTAFVRSFFPEGGVDERAWYFLNDNFRDAKIDARSFLSLLGFGNGEICRKCGKKVAERFFVIDHTFLCVSCSSKMPDNQLLYI